jgi:voltage-gated potassium channel
VEELLKAGAEVVVIEVDTTLEPALAEADIPHLIDDPATESALERAGIRRAKALLCAVDSDAVNVYITLTARAMNPGLIIIARASQPGSVDTLRRAGSDRVVPLYSVSGARMAALALQPAVLEFVDMVSVAPDLRIEELRIGDRSPLVSQTVRDMCEPHANVMVLAVRAPDGTVLVPPQAETVISNGDLLIILGPADALSSLAAKAG